MTGFIHEGDVSTVLVATIVDHYGTPVNLSTATVLKVYFKKPNGARIEKTAVFDTTGIDGRIKYTIIAGDIDMAGTWERQWHIEMPAGIWTTDSVSFFVADVI